MKKTMSLVLAITMVLSVLAITPVMAETTGVPTDQDYTIVAAVAGTNAEYGWKVYDADSDETAETLEIYYTGMPKNYKSDFSDRPWQSEIANITAVVIKGTPTRVAEYAFSGMTNLKSVVFAGTEQSIEKQAFSGCKALTGVFVVPKTVDAIKGSAFMNTRIASMIFEGDVNTEEIAVENLVYLGELTNITLFRPLTTTSTTVKAFGGTYASGSYGMTSPARINVLTTDASFVSGLAALDAYTTYDSDSTSATNKTNKEYNLNPGTFGDYTLINRSNGVSHGAFVDGVWYLEYTESDGTKTVEFITNGDEDGTNIASGTVLDSKKTTFGKMVFGVGFKAIPGSFGAKYTALKELKLPATMTTIGGNAFDKVATLSKVNFEDTQITEIGAAAFRKSVIKEIRFPATIKTIKMKAFADNTVLECIYIPSASNLVIGGNTFEKDSVTTGYAGKNLKVVLGNVTFTTKTVTAFAAADATAETWRTTTIIYNSDNITADTLSTFNFVTPVADKYYEVSDADNDGNINLFMCNFNAAQNYKLFMGTYAGNALNNAYMLKEGTLAAGSFINTEIDSSANIVADNTKVFLWDGFANCKPLTTGIFTK